MQWTERIGRTMDKLSCSINCISTQPELAFLLIEFDKQRTVNVSGFNKIGCTLFPKWESSFIVRIQRESSKLSTLSSAYAAVVTFSALLFISKII